MKQNIRFPGRRVIVLVRTDFVHNSLKRTFHALSSDWMMSLADALSSLCFDVTCLIANHLEVDDIGRMDSAMCDTQCRSALLPKFILHGPAFSVKRFFTACICRNVSSESAALFEIWIAKRRVKLRERLVIFGCSVPWFALWNIVSATRATRDYIGGACFFALHEKIMEEHSRDAIYGQGRL